jgi:hypothetical protein
MNTKKKIDEGKKRKESFGRLRGKCENEAKQTFKSMVCYTDRSQMAKNRVL